MGFWEIAICTILIYGIYKWGDKMAENYMKQARSAAFRRWQRDQNSRY